MIIVSGLHRKTAQVRTASYLPGKEGDARKFRAQLRTLGYTTTLVNDVKERYREAAGRCANTTLRGKPWKCACSDCVPENKPFAFEGIAGYQLHSLGTGRGTMKDKHIVSADSHSGAVMIAEDKVNQWSDSHKGVVIYKAIALVRAVTKPTTEIVELVS